MFQLQNCHYEGNLTNEVKGSALYSDENVVVSLLDVTFFNNSAGTSYNGPNPLCGGAARIYGLAWIYK